MKPLSSPRCWGRFSHKILIFIFNSYPYLFSENRIKRKKTEQFPATKWQSTTGQDCFYETLSLSSLLLPASSRAWSTLLTLRFFRLVKVQRFIILRLNHFSHNNILTSLIILMESMAVLAATWHTKIDSPKDQICF